jgi:hypothetical protein
MGEDSDGSAKQYSTLHGLPVSLTNLTTRHSGGKGRLIAEDAAQIGAKVLFADCQCSASGATDRNVAPLGRGAA